MVKDFLRRFRLNSAIINSLYWIFSVDDKGHENYMPVGRGVQSSSLCGKHVGFSVCKNVEGHKGVFVKGKDCTGKVVAIHRHLWCKRPLCPVCFIRGWAVRRARNIEARLAKAVELGFGKVEHIVVSPSVADHDLSEYSLRKKCRDALFECGVLGGVMLFHGYRKNKKRGVLEWSPHYHCLGFIEGDGFDRCRKCSHLRGDCASCDGVKGKAVRKYLKDGYIVKVLAERKTAFGTAHYQAHHATVRLGIKRFHAVTWFGVCGNRKYASKELEAEVTCPACGDEMVRSVYVGERYFVKDVGHPNYEPILLFDEFDEFGDPNFIDKGG